MNTAFIQPRGSWSVSPVFFLEVTRNRTVPFWSHHTLKPLAGDNDDSECEEHTAPGGGDSDGDGDKNKPCAAGNNSKLNTAGIDLDLDDLGTESDYNDVVDTWEGRGGDARKTYEDAMRGNIGLLREFCNALEYQIQF